ncbi:MAG: hypothetical protein ACYSVY_26075, partial [Planctomycetota bacterium]
LAWLSALGGALLALLGCGGPPSEVQTALSVTARALVVVDEELAPRVASAGSECEDSSESLAEWRDGFRGWATASDALVATGQALRLAQLARDGWEQGADSGGFFDAVPCLLAALEELAEGLVGLGVEIPEEVASALTVVGVLGVGSCDG